MSVIRPLATQLVHLMAAGEVIDSLAAVVRELAENAVDAGATRVAIAVWPEQWRVRVADNGQGMDWADLQQAALPYSTSKIAQWADLWQLRSLGFRGEALHSLAQLGDLQICSCRSPSTPSSSESDTGGWQVVYDRHGIPTTTDSIAIAPGTIVTVSDLFGAWPTRRHSLPSPTQQLRAIQLTIQQIALCHPHITWQVEQRDRPWFTLAPGHSPTDILLQILRDVKVGDLSTVEIERGWVGESVSERVDAISSETSPPPTTPSTLSLSLPNRYHRHRPDWIQVAVNGRCVQSPELEQTIVGAFRRTLPRDRFPVCFVHLHLAPDQVDWNRHPAKAEVYLQQLPDWQQRISRAIAKAVGLDEGRDHQGVRQLLKAATPKGVYALTPPENLADEATGAAPPLEPQELGWLRAIAQLHQTYIVAEHPGGVWLVEQHIAHERVLYEQICNRWQLVPLDPPLILSQLNPSQLEQLERIGLTVDAFGDHLWAVRSAPELLAAGSDCLTALQELSLCRDLQSAQVATACRSAIRNGTPLTLPDMQTLLNQWQQTRHPRTCPHGRPIYLSLEESALARFFRRHWVIGKSHGI